MQTRRKELEKQLTDRRKRIEKRTRKQVDRIESELRKNPVMKRLRELRKDAVQQIEGRVDSVMNAIPIATKSDLKRIERKISQISRKVKDLERGRKANGEGAHL